MKINDSRLKLFSILLLLFYALSFLLVSDHSFNQDLGRHLKLGKIIWETKEIPKTNLFSYTYPEFPFINHHYLFEVFTYLGSQFLTINGLLILKIIIILFSIGLTLFIVSNKSSLLLLPIGFIFLHTLRERVELRPEIFSFLFTALSYYLLTIYETKKTKLIFLLALIQFLWVNTHIYFPIGFILQIIFLISFYLGKRMDDCLTIGKVMMLSLILSLINPNALQAVLYPLNIFQNYGYTIAENQNLFLLESLNFKNPNYLFVKISALLIILSWIIGWIRKTLSLKNFLISLAGLTLALFHVRSFPYLIFLSLPSTLENIGQIKKQNWMKYLLTGVALIIFGESYLYLNGDYYRYTDSPKEAGVTAEEHGKKALDFVLTNNLEGPIFNNFDIGSYIIYRAYPKLRIFVDGRPEGYPMDFFQKIYIPMQENPEVFKKIDQEIGFKTIIFSHTDQTPWGKAFLTNIIKDPDWQTVYLDDFMIVLTKDNIASEKKLKKIILNQSNPQNYQFNNSLSFLKMSLFFYNSQATSSAKLFAEKALNLNPQSPLANLLMVNLISQENSFINVFQKKEYQEKSKNFIWW